MRVAVAGGTGLVGTLLVAALHSSGHQPVLLARALGIDVLTGTGLDRALDGVQAVVDVLNVPTTRQRPAVAFFTRTTANLTAAGRRAGVGHHVVLSIVGVDRVPFGYYQGKLAQERLVLAGAGPDGDGSTGPDGSPGVSVLRATQFHEFARQTMARSPGPVVVVPRMRIQPVAASEVAQALAALAVGPPVGRAPELAGPQVLELTELVAAVLRADGSRRRMLPIRLPGAAGGAMAGGGLLPTTDAPRGRVTFEEWLAASST